MKAKVKTAKPIVTEVTLTLSPSEAELLATFVGKTKLSVVKELLQHSSDETHQKVNGVLFDVYNALTDAGFEPDY